MIYDKTSIIETVWKGYQLCQQYIMSITENSVENRADTTVSHFNMHGKKYDTLVFKNPEHTVRTETHGHTYKYYSSKPIYHDVVIPCKWTE